MVNNTICSRSSKIELEKKFNKLKQAIIIEHEAIRHKIKFFITTKLFLFRKDVIIKFILVSTNILYGMFNVIHNLDHTA